MAVLALAVVELDTTIIGRYPSAMILIPVPIPTPRD
jgi:hypothetical protein